VVDTTQDQVDGQSKGEVSDGPLEAPVFAIPMNSLQETDDLTFPNGDEKAEAAFVVVVDSDPQAQVQPLQAASGEPEGKSSSVLPPATTIVIHQES
jgi:hypothetical protein